MRLKIFRIIVAAIFLGLFFDLVFIQGVRGKYYHRLSVNNRIRIIPLEGARGRILDRNGQVLAGNRLSFDVAVIPQDIQDKETLFAFLSEVLNQDKKDLLRFFQQKRVTPFSPVVVAYDVEKSKAMILEENRFRFPGLYLKESFRRWYPFKEIGAHVLGYVGKIDSHKIKKLKEYGYTGQSIIGYTGIEEEYDADLRGIQGGEQVEVNSQGRQVRLLGLRPPGEGKDVQLTLDARMQQAAVKALDEKHGAIVIMDLDTGEILALVSSPDFNPNVFSDEKLKKQRRVLFMDPGAPMLNRVIKGQYPPGSVFKTVMTVAGLETGEIDTETIYDCPGFLKLGRRRFRCAHVHGKQNIVQALGHSCNVYFYNVGLALGPDRMHKYARMFGFGEKSGVDLPGEEEGQVPSRAFRKKKYSSGWYDGDSLNFSIGQGDLLVTPVQVVRMMAAVARGGEIIQPYLVSAVDYKAPSTTRHKKDLRISDGSIKTAQKGLRTAVTSDHGTARVLDMEGFEFYGKTGTAQTAPGKSTHAWFAGYNLEGKRRVAFCVFLEYGGSSYYAVRVTKNLFKDLRKAEIL